MQELIKIESKPAVLAVNFEVLKAALSKELEHYKKLTVSADTVSAARKAATEVNQTKKVISERRKAEVARSSAPIKAFDGNMKELEGMCDEVRSLVLDKVKVFDDLVLERLAALLRDTCAKLWDEQGTEPEFRRAQHSDLLILKNITDKGNLAAAAKKELEARVARDKALQDQTRMRLLSLENQSYKAGLAAPLTRDHVESFLFAAEDAYQRELDRIIAAEIGRQKAAEDRFRAQVESEQQRKAVAEEQAKAAQPKAEQKPETKPEAAQAPAPQSEPRPAPRPEPAAPAKPAPAGKVSCTVTADFSICIDASITDEAIQNELRKVMEKAGITSLTEIRIHRHEESQAA